MKKLLDTLPEQLAPQARLSDEEATIELESPDFDDVIRPQVERELLTLSARPTTHFGRNFDMAPHLLWTFGPHHRDLPFQMQLRCELEGDRFKSVDTEIGWLHQGLERDLEAHSAEAGFALAARTQPGNSIAAELCYAGALEELFGISALVPHAAQLWRVVALEVGRALSHTALISTLARAHASQSVQNALIRAREELRSILGQLVSIEGEPVFRCIGGIRLWPKREQLTDLSRIIPDAVGRAHTAATTMGQSTAFIDALTELAGIEQARAVELGLSGPLLRACGAYDDIRTRYPYFGYDGLPPRIAVRENGDALARFWVRTDELTHSAALAVRALSKMKPEGVQKTEALPDDALLQPLPKGRASFSVEAPSGEFTVGIVSAGTETPLRVRLRGPSFPLAQALGELLTGRRVDEAVTVIEGLGIVGTEVDR